MSDKWDKWYYFKREEVATFANDDKTESSPLDLLVPIAGLGFLAALGIVGWQLFTYLKGGSWPSLSVVTALQWCGVEWASFPQDWLGVYKVLDSIPLALALPFIGIAPLYAYISWPEKVSG